MDFEKSSINAFQQVFPTVRPLLCFFHFAQSALRLLTNKFRMKNKYLSNKDFRRAARMVTMLAFVPLGELEKVIEALYVYYSVNYPMLLRLLWSVENTYIGYEVRDGRKDPRFKPDQWNHFDNVINGLPITNNSKEGSIHCNRIHPIS